MHLPMPPASTCSDTEVLLLKFCIRTFPHYYVDMSTTCLHEFKRFAWQHGFFVGEPGGSSLGILCAASHNKRNATISESPKSPHGLDPRERIRDGRWHTQRSTNCLNTLNNVRMSKFSDMSERPRKEPPKNTI